MQKTRVTQIQVRVDCNGCVQKIKKALKGILGIHDLHIDFNQQKLTITGWAEPETIVNAIKKTRKKAIICADIELSLPPSQTTESKPKANHATVDNATQLPPEASPPPPEATPPWPPTSTENNSSQQWERYPGRKDVREVHVIHHHLPNYLNRVNSSPVLVTESYNSYMLSHYVSEYEYVMPPPVHTHYNLIENYGGNGIITSMFSDDNPNACCIV
ncbi:hypothetical protein HN51_002606 [Arachis hypogaea]|uniref:HMA domain-containing protein n=1 Tax=Arachis hypogaea TaxID=3818 RepID=A0A445EM31_ARAHY|nr:heavy metal-associated isoprenylated plant protein 9-like [Arachis hypogaea]RYR76436.1 hypothetical protein Ahy_A01g001023 [Arachis hypogaea]